MNQDKIGKFIAELRKNKKLKVLSPIIANEQIGKKPDGSPIIRYSFAPVISFFENGKEISTKAVILATGHSARDVFKLLYDKRRV